jgi:hypothetical protein
VRSISVFSVLALVGAGFIACSSDESPASPGSADAGATTDAATDAATDPADGSDGATTNGNGGTGWVSGTRLRAVLQVAGTVKRFVRWHDTQLAIDCKYAVAADSQIRCIPDAIQAVYDDAACTSAVVSLSKAEPTPAYVSGPFHGFACGKGPDYFAPGTAYTPTSLYYWDGTSCQPGSAVDAANNTYVHLGSPVAPSTFAGKTDAVDPRGARLSAKQYVGADGSKQDATLLDSARGGAACDARETTSKAYYCTPSALAYLEAFFSDAACTTTPVAFYPDYAQTTCNAVPTAIQDSSGAATPSTLFYELGAKVTSSIYQGAPGSCTPFVSSSSFYAKGAPIALSSLASLSVANEGADRMQLTIARTETRAFAADLGFYDGQEQTTCSGQLATDGQQRCIPYSNVVLNLFADDTCTQGVVEWPTGQAPPTAGMFVQAQGALQSSTAVFKVGAQTTAPATAYQRNGANCEMRGLNVGYDYYATTAVAPAALVAVTTTME